MNWHYEEAPLNGGAPGDAFKSSFNGAGKKPAAILAREAIQNSVDAALQANAPVTIDFQFKTLADGERIQFAETMALSDMESREPSLGLHKKNAIKDQKSPLQLLYIHDYDTSGLKGDPTSPSSNLRKLLMDLGGSDKAHDSSGTGGSYGFGKAVYSSNSRIGTIFAFSRTVDGNGNPISVLMGCAYQASHDFNGNSYTGRAWFGVQHNVPEKGVRYDPFQGEEAEKLARALGFEREDGSGTSILLIDTDLRPDDLIAGIEDWWWPRIDARLLYSKVIDDADDEHFPRPKKRKHLKPFVESFDMAKGVTPTIPGKQAQKTFNRLDSLQIGSFGSVVVDDSQDENPFGEEYEELLDTVALIRSPLMVVDYYRKWRPTASAPPAVGCFLAANDIDRILKLSEPPAHDKWDPSAGRLTVVDEEYPNVVQSTLQRIKKSFRDFQASAKPPAPPRPKRLAKLERELATWFGAGPKNQTPPPGPNPAPISLRLDGPHLEKVKDGLRARGYVEVRANGQMEGSVPFRIGLTLQVAEEDSVSQNDPIPLTLTPDLNFKEIDDDLWAATVDDQTVAQLEYVSEIYDPDWTVQLMPEVLPFTEEEQ
ncbi:MAG: hypothetical protein JXJ30_00830 [Halothiobacillaceae bacterium]|nr:hypothetical protein [Halothiobacillaceae bacterium]HER34402.1 hypothetical protein [Halothiobacillaceae bacterium]